MRRQGQMNGVGGWLLRHEKIVNVLLHNPLDPGIKVEHRHFIKQGERLASFRVRIFWIRQFIAHNQTRDELVFVAMVVPPAPRPVAA